MHSSSVPPLILNLRTRRGCVTSLKNRSLYPWGRIPQYSLNTRMVGHNRHSERGGEEKNILPLLRYEPGIVQALACTYTGRGTYTDRENFILAADWVISIRGLDLAVVLNIRFRPKLGSRGDWRRVARGLYGELLVTKVLTLFFCSFYAKFHVFSISQVFI
jgi:hypothetical protein